MFTTVLFYALSVLATEDNTQSVLVPTPATQEVPAVATPELAAAPSTSPEFVCVNGKCRRVTGVEEQTYETQRRRIFGGHVIRNGTRTVYKTSRR
jgi:hypothetical protein